MQSGAAVKSQHTQKVSIVLIEDHDLVRYAIKRLLEGSGQFTVVAEASDGEAALALIKNHRPDLVLLDIALPGRNGLEVLREAASCATGTRIVLLTMYEDPIKIQQALTSGAAGYVLKSCPPDLFTNSLLKVHQGEIAVPKQFEYLLSQRDKNGPLTGHSSKLLDPLGKLSKREREVFYLLADGQPNRVIAKRLLISPRTVETHRARVIKKLGFSSTADLVRYAIRHSLLSA